MKFIGGLDEGIYNALKNLSNEELSKILHDGGYASYQTWGKVVQVMLKRVCTERNYDPWTYKPIKSE